MARRKNSHGLWIEVACLSCKYATIIQDEWRRCHHGKDTTPRMLSYSCPRWKMKKGLEAAGNGDGRVKSHKYQLFFLSLVETWDAKSGKPYPSVDEVRKMYREQFKEDIYIRI